MQMKNIYGLIIVMVAAVASGCTDLEEGIYGQQVADEFYASDIGVNAALASVYNEVRGDWNGKGIAGADRGWYDLNETCTDEMMFPTRSDGAWDDNGIWRAMYTHTWTGSQEFIGNTWNWLYRSIYKTNLSVELLEGAGADPAQIAEARVLRAYFYYMLMDGWGSVPFYTGTDVVIEELPQLSRAEIFDFVVNELETNVDLLPETKGGSFYGRFNKWAGYALLAKINLNAEVYTGSPRWSQAITACDAIINNGGFSLVSDLYDNAGSQAIFGDEMPNQEVILSVFVDANDAPRNIIGIRTLHGPHGNALFGFSTWNGATVHQDFINRYSDDDKRKAQWLLGSQPGGVNYTLNISSLTSAGIEEGARSAKFLPVPPYSGESASNDFPVFRYADVLLTKAEAILRNGGDEAAARALVDEVRNRAGLDNYNGAMTLNEVYNERGRELCWEGHRRQDMIRYGTFTAARSFKGASSDIYKLFPIPSDAIANNDRLVQNPGY
ncbi:MAG: RagB/SusD family nutrient uptake outer membrane protein [Flammeovirgaceae bacterium]|nr:RagB/SusD family nutrient uptake outer membrane protein [Flammeovirgaceae bacterium]MBE61761.1 RagB/SusD family nutrient uptake outer membrane protein [Flammeovirgaceae bacterium]MBR07275.1 RagB/SusD family nutrient uptake outer membrane protein [Rickettsiales bacterium]HCX23981.1 RagB/SusD family nutrient uptake outer membrane protein [Cytophagales bacterium]